ncbi:hypothetical protein Bca52824_011506 [Brassica carinata]|uniref:Uncharacterized protein n=1 Tax=Brassica carinata TaxID=52824 RepID=A0A8X8BBW1_BRACI|nr:hypothetical protein Bca52824_011506 [Brassica carinata]
MISSHAHHLLPSSRMWILMCSAPPYVLPPRSVPPIFRYGAGGLLPAGMEENKPATAIGLSEVCIHAIPTGAKFTPKPRKVIALDTTNLSSPRRTT